MIEYSGEYAYVDDYKFRRDANTGYYLATRQVNGRRPRLHVYVWEKFYGPVPRKYQVHHVDKNKDNNEIENFELIAISEHMKLHGVLTDGQKSDRRKNLKENAISKAKEWHASKEGRDWHSKHGVEVAANLEPQKFVCENCGVDFLSKPNGVHRFCSNNCKSAWRRRSGADNVVKKCERCGGEYIADKYQKTTRCKACKNKGFTRSRKPRCL